MANINVLKQITWLHELVYGTAGQHTIYDELPLTLFIQGYLVIIESDRPHQWEAMLKHLSKLMDDVVIYMGGSQYGHIMQSHCNNSRIALLTGDLGDDAEKLEFRQALVWN